MYKDYLSRTNLIQRISHKGRTLSVSVLKENIANVLPLKLYEIFPTKCYEAQCGG